MRHSVIKMIMCVVLCLTFAAGCVPVHTSVKEEKTVDFSQFKTFNWSKNIPDPVGLRKWDKEEFNEHVKSSVAAELTMKGYSESPSPDFTITYRFMVRDKIKAMPVYADVDVDRDDHSMSWEEVAGHGFREGTIEVEFTEATTNKPFWKGNVKADVNEYSSDKRKIQVLDRAIEKVLKKVPKK